MKSMAVRMRYAVLAAALLATPAAAFAQEQVPAREGNIWDGFAHQPTEAQVQQETKRAGVAPSPSQEKATAATVDRLYRELMGDSRP